MGALAKTDALDARMLAAFAGVLHRHPERKRLSSRWPTPSCGGEPCCLMRPSSGHLRRPLKSDVSRRKGRTPLVPGAR
jgi:hypothetical protein